MAHCLLLLLLVVSSSVTLISSQDQCTEEASLLQLTATPPSPYNGINSDTSRCNTLQGLVICTASAAAIIDDNIGPMSVNLGSEADVQMFFTWSGQADITFSLSGAMELASLELYFLNYPGEGIGLPDIELFRLTGLVDPFPRRINYAFDTDNSDVLSPTDNIRRKVTLGILENQNLGSYAFLRVNFSFPEVNNNSWFFLSEIKLCRGTPTTTDMIQFLTPQLNGVELSPNNPPRSVQLRCSVSLPGMFEWLWTRGGDDLNDNRYQVSTTDGTRTGILDITGLHSSDEGSYTCRVNRQGQSTTEQQDVTLVLPVAVTTEPTVFARPGGSVQLTCEAFGYLRPGQPFWSRSETGDPIQSGGRFTIMQQDGNRPSQSSDGSSTFGLVTVLTINQLDDGDTGNYFCSAVGVSAPVMAALNVTSTPPTPTNPETTSPGTTPGVNTNGTADSNNSGANAGIIAAAVIVSLLFIVALVITLVVIVILVMRWRKRMPSKHDLRTENGETHTRTRRYTADDIQWQLYSTVGNNNEAPPIPARNYDESELEDIANIHYGHSEQPKERRLTLSSSPPKLSKLTDTNKYTLLPNPIYESSTEALTADTTKSENLTSNELHIYSPPSLERSETPSTSLRSSEPIYSEALEPSMFSQKNPSNENDLHPYGPIYANPKALKKAEAPLEITAANIREVKQLGIGEFGEVVLAETIGVSLKDMKLSQTDDDKSVRIQVAIKKLKPLAKNPIREAFEKEIKFMSRLKDDNIVRLLAICTANTPCIVMEYMENGDLNQYLQKHDLAPSEGPVKPNQLPVSILLYMAVQIASGMRYLASLKYVHRDLATRNCLVGMNFTIKISDFGMSRNLYEHSYYRVRGRAMLPIRWMATESFYGRFSEKTDIWSFGVIMWEIFTLAKTQPYEELDDQEMIQDAIRGASRRLLDRPGACPMEAYQVMLRCWEYSPEDRATFEEAFNTLAAIHRKM